MTTNRRTKRKPAVGITVLLLLGALMQSPPAAATQASRQPVNRELRTWIASIAPLDEQPSAAAWLHPPNPLAQFYRQVGFRPVWTGPDGLLPQAEILLSAMANASEVGLFPEDYRLPDLTTIRIAGVSFSDALSLTELAPHVQFDVMLTEGLLRYAQDLSQGRISPEMLSEQRSDQRRPSTGDIPAELAAALKQSRLKAYIESLHPRGEAYHGLKKALQQYEQIQRSGGWPTIAPGPTLRPGDFGPRVDALRGRLLVTQDLPADSPGDHSAYDPVTKAAVVQFQIRHGLNPDGLVGKGTLAELNIPVGERISRLQLNMERWRWLPDSLGDRYLLVNIPAFTLSVVETGTPVHTLRAIVGRKHRQTPILSGRISYLEFNPYWNIPPKIARKDILPKVIGDPAYLARQGIRVFDSWDGQARELDPAGIAWENLSASTFPYRLRQDPSDLNALGQVKFMFPNHHSVYIHDTPGKALFQEDERIFSSGCVRVDAPMVLARYLLRNQGWDPARLEAAMGNGRRQTVVLDDPIPVHLVYFTAWVDEDGRVQFRPDVYGHDRRLLAALKTRTSAPVYCNSDAKKGRLLAVGSAAKTGPLSTVDTSDRVAVGAIEPTGKMAGHPMTGI